jgi:soluble epoxide hydrolase / lipid-phosphate phosphatase
MHYLLLLASSLLPILTLASSTARDPNSNFDPNAFHLQVATCPGINRAENNKIVDLNLGMFPPIAVYTVLYFNSCLVEYVDVGNPNANRTLLFVHGWPSLWASWKYQIQEFQV